MDKWADEELFEELSARDYDSLTEEEKSLLEQLCIEYEAECGCSIVKLNSSQNAKNGLFCDFEEL